MAFARLNGVVIHHEVRGDPSKPAVVFSNSLGCDFRIWNKVAAELADDYRLVLYDKRGHGLSEAPPQPYSMDDHIDDLVALLDHVGVDRAAVIGLSVGGMIAQGLAIRYPERVTALVLCDTAHKIGDDALWNMRIETVNTKGISALTDSIMQRWFMPEYRTPDNPDFVGYTAMLTRTTTDGYAGTSAALRDTDYTELTRKLKVPTLCLGGDHDGSTPPSLMRELASLIEGSEYTVIENAGHLPCIDQPARTASVISDFLGRTL
ncbi:3-oxoadipate enol-lactonase [Nitratireductor indicus C115]|uniref:3-oxoadipate enol-lactonase n=1 Tax=Nitratireductor indicus C115 TaxID=1231190 RepID=K2PJB4_9HYPH|nr:3-oxoadipate enol-lactonase [Nitratireductor indicus]EKF41247.1 3-oxoadipate enol-lactonase [Nitratireductor indicus C115]SFQ65094.1 3-oxoadipate enol-lactonase [Nitratireductor indicus]